MQDLNDLYLFAQAVEHGGFTPAGRALDIPKSTLSRRVAGLEKRLGVRLIQRSTRHFSVTEIGHEYHRHCLAMLVEAESADEVVERHRSIPQGIVRLSCPTALLSAWVGPMLAEFMAQYPLVELQVESTNRSVDLIQEGMDLALRVRFPPLENSELVMKTLGESRQVLVAASELRARLPKRPTPLQVASLPTLHWGSQQREYHWEIEGSGRIGY